MLDCFLAAENDKLEVLKGEDLVNGVLWLKTYRVKSKEKSCIRVNIRELNEVSKYNLSILYILG